MELHLLWITFTVFCAAFFIQCFYDRAKKLPPGPKGLPIIGHFHLLGKNPHQDLQRLAKDYGPIMYMRFGFVPNIIVSSPAAAELFLKTHDLVFAGRPPHQAAKYLSWDQKNLSFSGYGSYWRNLRKLFILEILSNVKVQSFQPMRREELDLLIEDLKKDAFTNKIVDLSAKISFIGKEMSCRMVFGKKYEDKDVDEKGFKGLIQQGLILAAVPNLGDYFPFIGLLDLQGLNKKMKVIAKAFDDFFEKILDEHVRSGDSGHNNMVSTMMSLMESGETDFPMDRRHVKANLLEILGASMDTSATTVEWLISELLKNPQEMKKVQKELEEVVGLERMVEESDLDKLLYLNMVIKETFRLHPVAPLLLPHYSMEDCNVDGYNIPKNSRIIINVYAIGRDPSVWNEPDKFIPERFIGKDIDVKGQDFELIPFGSGRRGCPGLHLGLLQVQLVAAQLIHCFNFKLADSILPNELDMVEEFGIVVGRANHLLVIPSYRLKT